jgi:hypothetical protein
MFMLAYLGGTLLTLSEVARLPVSAEWLGGWT